jgi:hypothetical protein
MHTAEVVPQAVDAILMQSYALVDAVRGDAPVRVEPHSVEAQAELIRELTLWKRQHVSAAGLAALRASGAS